MPTHLLLLALAAWECRAQSPACFDARAELSLNGRRIETHATAEHLEGPGWPRSHYRLGHEVDALLAPLLEQRTTALVCGSPTRLVARGAWRLVLKPTDAGVATQLEGATSECRTRAWTVTRVQGRTEILVEDLSP